MATLSEIEAAVKELSVPEKQALYRSLVAQLEACNVPTPERTHSVLDIATVSLDAILIPWQDRGELLDDFLDER